MKSLREEALAQTLGSHPVALMRGHGMLVVGRNIKEAR
jgi:ribulose-5-phosphate 4-epimerase/fuculose-1-phosphate aldolase